MADLTVTAANVIPSAQAVVVPATAGVALAAGQVVYLDPTTKTVKLADANAAAPANVVYGITANDAAVGQQVDVIKSDLGGLAIGATVAAGATLVLSATPGNIAPDADATTGWYKTILGVGIGSNQIYFRPLAAGVAM